MREALAGLTVRGRAFLAAGVTAIVCAILLGQPTLTRVGVLIARRCRWSPRPSSARSRYRLAWCAPSPRSWSPPASRRRVNLTLTNEGRTPSGVLLLEDHVPYVLGTRPRFVLDGIGHGWRRHVTYQVRSDVRGRFEIGPMTRPGQRPLRAGRARPLVPHHGRRSPSPRAPCRSPTIPLGGAWTGSGDNRPRAFAIGSAEDVTVREYRRGDDLRRVHWRSSAPRRRADGAPRGAALAVAGDALPRQPAARPPRPGHRLLARGRGLGRRLDRGAPEPARLHGPAGHRHRRGPQQRLALPRRRPQHRSAARGARRRPGRPPAAPRHRLAGRGRRTAASRSRSSAASRPTDVPVLRRMQQHAGSALAIALDVDAWVSPRPAGRRGRRPVLGPAGLARRAAAARATGSTTVWQDLGRTSAQQLAVRPTAVPRPRRWSGERSPRRLRRPACSLAGAAAAHHLGRDVVVARASPIGARRFLGPLLVLGVVVAGTGVAGPLVAAARRRWSSASRCWSPGLVASTMLCGSPLPVGGAWVRLASVLRRRPGRRPAVRRAGARRTHRRRTRC